MSDDNTLEEDAKLNAEDAEKLEDTDKFTAEDDGEQPAEVPAWNDDSGEIEIL
jgi:hypothetical protein